MPKRVATTDAGCEQIEYLTTFAGPQPEPHGKTRKSGMCLSILLMLYVYFRLEYELCSLAGVLQRAWYL